jgi:hypothetical protein
MTTRLFVAFLLVISALLTTGQTQDSISKPDLGDVKFVLSSKIDSLEKKMRGKSEMKGYRVQIFLGSYADAKNARARFLNSGMKMQAYIEQNTPDYVVRVGDFRTTLEAQKYYAELKKIYPQALLVVNKIEPPRFYK